MLVLDKADLENTTMVGVANNKTIAIVQNR
jgi:hypothetical protein